MIIDSQKIPTQKYNGAFLEFTYGSNGAQGGDSGHGCRSLIRIESMGADLRLNKEPVDKIEIITGGDAELLDLALGLQTIGNKLKEIYDLTLN